jgi:Dual specificity phosphatase, catalytic domain
MYIKFGRRKMHGQIKRRFIFLGGLSGPMRILVHCENGISRSAAVLAAWIMTLSNLSPSKSLEFLRLSRFEVRINPGFMQQLLRWRKQQDHLLQKRTRNTLVKIVAESLSETMFHMSLAKTLARLIILYHKGGESI